jgi:hypothetical protein
MARMMAGKKITINNQGQFAGNVDSPRGRVQIDRQQQVPDPTLHESSPDYSGDDADRRTTSQSRSRSAVLWLDGLFFTLAFVVILAALGFVVNAVPGWLVPLVLVAALVAYTLIGASVLRLQGPRGLSEAGTLTLAKQALRLIPIIRGGRAISGEQDKESA